jgi:hypothetical protein
VIASILFSWRDGALHVDSTVVVVLLVCLAWKVIDS